MSELTSEHLESEFIGIAFEDEVTAAMQDACVAEARAVALEGRLARVLNLADAWEAYARSLDPIHKDRASIYQDCADELRERAKGEP